jgi:hypothetical protein
MASTYTLIEFRCVHGCLIALIDHRISTFLFYVQTIPLKNDDGRVRLQLLCDSCRPPRMKELSMDCSMIHCHTTLISFFDLSVFRPLKIRKDSKVA